MYPLHADHLLQLRESKTSERLGEDVRELPTSFDELDEGDDRHGGGIKVSSRIRERLLNNLLLPYVNTAREDGAERPPAVIL